MTNLKNVLSVGLAAATLVVFLTVTISGGALRAGLAPWPGIGAIVLATLAFVVSWKHRSFLVAGLLAASGVTGIIAGVINTQYFAVIVFPGPILGVIIGLGILGLGVAKGMGTAKATLIAPGDLMSTRSKFPTKKVIIVALLAVAALSWYLDKMSRLPLFPVVAIVPARASNQ
jgi:hypothetical protein